ncbi:MAG TPA: class I SAM-dependent methyltransferase [Myxococcaceae bacterium]|nr:class I SAM-dependent methyltransferase [Myxococcaceae bacterium]
MEARAPFLSACPLCGDGRAAAVVAFAELTFGRCLGCGVIYKREQAPGLGGEGYDEEYFRFNRARYLQRWPHRVRKCRNQVRQCLEFNPSAKRLLDVGCSAGYVLAAAEREGLEATGLDSAEFAVELCRSRGLRAEVGSLTRMPFPDGSFDIVTAKHTLEHVAQPMDGLREIARVLRPGGVAFVQVPDAAYYKIPLMPRRGRSFRPDRRGWQHHVYFYERNLADACAKATLAPVKIGKDIFRRRLAQGPRWAVESARWLWMLLWTHGARLTRIRREIQIIARRELTSLSKST